MTSPSERGVVLSGLRVLDFTTGPAGGMASTVLADFGADVLKIEPPDGDRFQALASSALWLRGKRRLSLDLHSPADLEHARERAAAADVVLVSGPAARLATWGLVADSLCPAAPNLVHCSISGWGPTGPLANLPAYEGLVAAKAGRMHSFEVQLNQGRPVYAAVPVATHIAAQSAVHGILAALFRRETTGRGARVETSLLQGLMPFDLVDSLASQLQDRRGEPYDPLRTLQPMPTLNYHPVRTSDGHWIQCGNLLEHLFYSFLDATDLLGELLIEDQFQGSPAEWSDEAIDIARNRILVRVQEKTAAEWIAIFEANGNVAAERILTADEALDHLDMTEGQALIELTDDVFGRSVQIGPIAELESSPAVIPAAIPSGGRSVASSSTETSTGPVAPADGSSTETPSESVIPSGGNHSNRPLAGVTILDLATIIAGPLGISMLADLGARVIKVEPYGGDPFRGMLTEGRIAARMNAGKESICIDLKKPEGQAILHQLVADADVLVHNFRANVPEKLGIDYPTLAAINPKLIWAVVNGYGPHGPSALRPATHPVMGAACSGVAYQAGAAISRDCPTLEDVREAARQIMAANDANPDPNTSVVAASAILLALVHRTRSDKNHGQVVRINMQTANAWANADAFVRYDNHPGRAPVDDGYHGLHAGYRLYATADGWVFLAATTDQEFAAFCAAIDQPDLANQFATAETRRDNDDELVEQLTSLFADRSADHWEAVLTAAGVGCVRADGIDFGRFLSEHPHMHANGWAPEVEHARFGKIRRWGPTVTVDGLNPTYQASPLAGEHTDALLEALGHDDEAIQQLRADRVVNSEPIDPVP